MHHLTPEELIDGLDRSLPSARQTHAETCAACRAERRRLAAMVQDVAAVDVPEPSPLFWDHLSARIRERVAHEPLPAAGGWLSSGWLSGLWPRWTLAGAILAICAVLGWIGWGELRRNGTVAAPGSSATHARGASAASPDVAVGREAGRSAATSASSSTAASTISPAADPDASRPLDPADSEWALMVRVAENVAWDDAESASMYVRPATVERALNELSSDERRALVQLLRAEMARPSS